uniref:Uncharacterized protein n=1 Tax=Oryza sativa subsp. japonica TaxID=39947 RepID=Q8H4W7_ORYSJ|nr:hypothetical protein [Oryza sativa Japonica Group]BAD03875.1 hypothetical protein [Oryza sativa Japonica Group]
MQPDGPSEVRFTHLTRVQTLNRLSSGAGAGLAGARGEARERRRGGGGRRGDLEARLREGRRWWPDGGRGHALPSARSGGRGGDGGSAAADLAVSALGSGGGGLRRVGASGHGGGSCDNDDGDGGCDYNDANGGCDEDDERPPPSTAPPASTPTHLGSARVVFQRPPNSRRWIWPPRGSDLPMKCKVVVLHLEMNLLSFVSCRELGAGG